MFNLNVLNTLDWIVLILLLWSVVSGVWRGFSNEFFGFIGLIVAFIVTSLTGQLLDGPMSSMLPDNAMGRMFSRGIIFLACILVINIIAGFAASGLRSVISRPVDHSLGMVLGLMRGALIVLLPFLLVNLYIDPKVYPNWLVESYSYPFLTSGARALRQVIPESEINDHNRTDFAPIKKATKEAKEQEDTVKDMGKKAEKKTKDAESSGNQKWKDVIESLKENFSN